MGAEVRLAHAEACPCGCGKPMAPRRFATDAEVLRVALPLVRKVLERNHGTIQDAVFDRNYEIRPRHSQVGRSSTDALADSAIAAVLRVLEEAAK